MTKLASWLVRAWLATLRVRVVVDPALATLEARQWVVGFLHADLVGMVAWPRRRTTAALVSASRDGDRLARVLASMTRIVLVRGSTTRGGARALRALVRVARAQAADCAFAVDGPRGPRGHVHRGVVVCARALGAVLVPLRLEAPSALRLGSWDRAVVPLPFTQITIALGAPVDAAANDADAILEAALSAPPAVRSLPLAQPVSG